MIPPTRSPLHVDLLAAVHLREALQAAERGDRPTAVGHLMSIDAGSWNGIQERLAQLGSDLPTLIATLGDQT